MADTFHNARALVIGAGGDLPVTANDAKSVARILVDPERCAVPGRNVKVLTEDGATHEGIVAGLEELARVAAADDVVTVYFSGHGFVESGTPTRRFLVPHDRNRLDGRVFTELLGGIKARRLLVLLDCCYAGGMHADPGSKAAEVKAVPVPFNPGELRLRAGPGTMVLSSSRPDEVSRVGRPYSIFTQALIEALCGAGLSRQDGYVWVTDLAMHVAERVPQLTGDRQHPTLDLRAADNYPVAYYAAGSKSLRELPDWFADVATVLASSRTTAPARAGDSSAPPGTTMTVDNAIQALRTLLSNFVYDKDEAIRIVRKTKTPVPWSSDHVSFWDKALNNVHRSSRMEMLFAFLDEILGENADWQKAKQDYRLVCEAERCARDHDLRAVDATLNERYISELSDALGGIFPEVFHDPALSYRRLEAVSRAMQAVEPMSAMLHALATAEKRQPRRFEMQRADHTLTTLHKEVVTKISALRKVGSADEAGPLCDDLAQPVEALLAAYAQAIYYVT